MPRDSQSLNYTADVQTVYEVGTYSLLDSMDIDITVTGLGFSTVRGFFCARCNVRFKLDIVR